MRRTLIAATAASLLVVLAWAFARGTTTVGGADVASRVAIARDEKPVGTGKRAFHFERAIRARMGERELVKLQLLGSLWVAGHQRREQQPFEALVRIDSIVTHEGHMERLPLTRIRLTESTKNIEVQAGSGVADETRQAAARFALDIVDQYRFFSSSDLQGHYEARISSLVPGHYRKTKLRYLDAPYATGEILESRHELRQDFDAWPVLLTGTESLTLGNVSTDQLAVRSDTSYVITPAPGLDTESELAGAEWTPVTIQGTTPRQAVRRGIASVSESKNVPLLADLLATLRSGTLTTGAQRMGWFHTAVKRLDSEVGRLETTRDALAESRTNSSQFQLLVGALAGSTQPDAAAVLLEAYQGDRFAPDERALIMTAWIASDTRLSEATTSYLAAIATDASSTPAAAQNAMLALGSQLGKSSSGSGAAIEALLVNKLAQAQSEPEIIAALDAMGNSGATDFLPNIQPYLGNATAHVRAHAYLAVRLIPGVAVAALLNAGQSDASGEVQTSVQLALNMRTSADL